MSEIVEMNEIVTDVMVRELRVGDRVEAMFEEGLLGTVTEITWPLGKLIETGAGAATTEQPPKVTVEFDSGSTVVLEPEFLRVSAWRWTCLNVTRVL